MSLHSAIEDVVAFHRVTDTPVRTVPEWPADERIDLRVDLIVEEVLKELLAALARRDMVAASNGFVDSIYVLIGAAKEIGIPIEAEWDAVQFSNMAKAIEQPDGTFKVVRRPDGKILKPEGWLPPDTEGILRSHGWKGPTPSPRTTFKRDPAFANRCDNCSEKELAHQWVCIGCGKDLGWEEEKFLPASCSCAHGATLFCPQKG